MSTEEAITTLKIIRITHQLSTSLKHGFSRPLRSAY
ncbi:hypothetical protein MANES_15G130450v8 [Manihot esculenta]|uniref:Uncharacterized protein n=1 Tax=Manihot esculenta TaxID=3983 RepID=A0ACB7GBW6_MANES|nr:hypothetical protein MANES_15G130450v8 [Manihot esculenta]